MLSSLFYVHPRYICSSYVHLMNIVILVYYLLTDCFANIRTLRGEWGLDTKGKYNNIYSNTRYLRVHCITRSATARRRRERDRFDARPKPRHS